MVIDGHVHIWDSSDKGYTKGDGSLETLLKKMDENPEIGKVVLLPISPFVSNSYIGKVCAEHPDKLIGFASVDPKSDTAVETFGRDVRQYGLRGLKLHPRVQQMAASDERIVKLVKKAAELNVPVLIDCFPQDTAAFPVENLFPERIGELAQKVPEAKIIMAHVGGYKIMDAFAVAKARQNIYFDFSFSPHYYKGSSIEQDLVFVLKKIGSKRCIYGSDYPEVSMKESLEIAKEMVEKAGFSAEDKEYFFGKTLLSLLPA